MTTSLLRAGWAGVIVFAVGVIVGNGFSAIAFAGFFFAVAAFFLFLLRGRPSRAALIASGVVGGLYLIQMTFFVSSNLMEGANAIRTTVDSIGLLAALAIVAGTVAVWREARSGRGAAVPA